MTPNDEHPARPWRPASLQPQHDETPMLWRALSLGLAIAVVGGAMLWLAGEDGPPPAAPVERQARPRPPSPPVRAREDWSTPQPGAQRAAMSYPTPHADDGGSSVPTPHADGGGPPDSTRYADGGRSSVPTPHADGSGSPDSTRYADGGGPPDSMRYAAGGGSPDSTRYAAGGGSSVPTPHAAGGGPPDSTRHADGGGAPDTTPHADGGGPGARVDSRTRATRLMALPALPPPTTPMPRARPVLEPRAAAGDGVAACRLAFARARCEGEMRAGPIAPDGFCAGVQTDPLPRTEDLLQPAEPWLTPRQKVLLAMIRPDGGVARLARPGAAAPPHYVYPQYLADRAYDFLLEGFRARDPLALEGLAMVHAPGDPARWNRNGPVLPNPKLFVFYTGVLQRLHGEAALGPLARETLAATRATLDARDLADADAKAAGEVRLWLEARPLVAWQAEWEELQHGDLRLQDCAR